MNCTVSTRAVFAALLLALVTFLSACGDIGGVGRDVTNISPNSFAASRPTFAGSGQDFATGAGTVTTASVFGQSVTIQADGKFLVAGSPSSGAGLALVRYNSDGSLDRGFGIEGTVTNSSLGTGNSVIVQTDGKIVVVTSVGIGRYNPNGSVDSSFGTGGTVAASSAEFVSGALQTDGKILALAGGSSLLRYNTNGGVDTSFGTGGSVAISGASGSKVILQTDGKILVTGTEIVPCSQGYHCQNGGIALLRYNSNGSLDAGFGTGGKVTTGFGLYGATANSITVQADGKVLVVGSYPTGTSTPAFLVRYNADGSQNGNVITAFNAGIDWVNNFISVSVQADGRIVCLGRWSSYSFITGTSSGSLLVRYNSDLSLDTAFGTAGAVESSGGTIYSGALQTDGKIVAVGGSSLLRYYTDGSPDSTFGPNLSFTNQNLGTTSAVQSLTLSNTGGAPVSITNIIASGDFSVTHNCGAALGSNSFCTLNITFTPTAIGTRTGTVTITGNASNSPKTIDLTGTGQGGVATLSPRWADFGPRGVGTTTSGTFTLSNTGGAALNTVGIATSGDFAQTNNCGTSLAVGASCTINVTFTPTAVGTRNGSLTYGGPDTIILTGVGVAIPVVSLSSTALTFSTQSVGTSSAAKAVMLTNNGGAALNLSSISIRGPFSQTNNCGAGLGAGGSCAISVTFTPTAAGVRSGFITIASDAADSPYTVDLTGTGVGSNVRITPSDFDGDGKSDILWRNARTGDAFAYLMNGASVASQALVRTVSLDWKVAGTGDFNGDGKADILLRNATTGEAYVYLMNGTSISSGGSVRTVALDWEVAGIGDFDGDGKADILWRNVATGVLNIYFMNGVSVSTEASIATVSLESEVVAVVDFDGDGNADIMFRNRAWGQFYVYLMNGASVASQAMVRTVSLDWAVAATADFNGDGKADILWRNVATGEVYLYFMNGTSVSSEGSVRAVSPNWEVAQVGDFNGDGKADILWRNAKTGEAYAYLMNGTTVASEGSLGVVSNDWKTVTQKPRRKFKQTSSLRGIDTNGDGKADIFWRNAATGQVYVYQMNGSSVAAEGAVRTVSPNWEVAGYGDFNGDGKTDILWRDANSGLTAVYILDGWTVISEGAMRQVSLDWRVAAIGDFNGDGKDDIMWRNVRTGATYFYFLNGGSVTSEAAGRTITLDWEVAAAADFNGDGKADVVWRNITTGASNFHFMNGATVTSESTGPTNSLDWELAATSDFNGDHKSDILWRNATTGEVSISLMNGSSVVSVGSVRTVALDWEIAGIGDYNGDGRSDILWRALWSGDIYFYFLNGSVVTSEAAGRTVSLDWAADR